MSTRMVQLRLCLVLVLALEEILAQQENTTTPNYTTTESAVNTSTSSQIQARRQLENGIEFIIETRRKYDKTKEKKKKGRSTSSSSASVENKRSDAKSGSSDDESLDMSEDLSTSDSLERKDKKYERKSTAERKGWRKWHRKCYPCPEEMAMKWKDPSIKWICGAYQRAQRSFKSLCMMHYRNCQDGTMFTKIHDHRCKDDDEREGKPHGDHFFYTYNVALSADSSTSISSSKLSSDTDSAIYQDNDY